MKTFAIVIAILLLASTAWSNEIQIVVNSSNTEASDDNPGTEAAPLLTLGRALFMGNVLSTAGDTVRIVMHEGVYREYASWSEPEDKDITLIIEAYNNDNVVVSGSEIWSGWLWDPLMNAYVSDWPNDWGLATESPEWEDRSINTEMMNWILSASDILQRREMLFVNGQQLVQVLDETELVPGTFLSDDDAQLVYARPEDGVDMETATVEIAMREMLLWIIGSTDVTIRGITFEHSNPALMGTGVQITGSQNVTIENCNFVFNNWAGLKIGNCEDVTIRNSTANDNGTIGISGDNILGLVIEDSETTRNNWRGFAAGVQDFAVGGIRVHHVHNAIVRRHTSSFNYTRGIHFDTDNSNILVTDCNLSNNTLDGIFFEASQGPITIENSIVSNNDRVGIMFNGADSLHIIGNTIESNRCQMYISGTNRSFENWETGEPYTAFNVYCSIIGNVVSATEEGQELTGYCISPSAYDMYSSTLTKIGNEWNPWGGGDGEGFEDPKMPGGGETNPTLPGEYAVAAVYPNPFNPTTTTTIRLSNDADLKVEVYDITGREVAVLADGHYTAGLHPFIFNAGHLSSGTYLLRVVVPGKMNELRKITLVK